MKRGSSKAHPHNECVVCAEYNVSKTRERMRAKEQIQSEIENNEIELNLNRSK